MKQFIKKILIVTLILGVIFTATYAWSVSRISKGDYFADTPFLDFKNHPFPLELFADNQHLNLKGGKVFSRFFNDSIVRKEKFDVGYTQRLITGEKEFVKQTSDSTLSFDLIKNGRRALYTGGGKTENNDTRTNGIYIKKITDHQIEYSYSQLTNWKKDFDKKGIANLIGIADSISFREREEQSFKFVDSEKDIVIFITKNERINITKSKVYNKLGKQISVLMYNK